MCAPGVSRSDAGRDAQPAAESSRTGKKPVGLAGNPRARIPFSGVMSIVTTVVLQSWMESRQNSMSIIEKPTGGYAAGPG